MMPLGNAGVRNAVNYRQEFDTWHPHRSGYRLTDLLKKLEAGLLPKTNIDLHHPEDEIAAFVDACLAINAASRGTLRDMSLRCPQGRSFLQFGPVGLLHLLNGGK